MQELNSNNQLVNVAYYVDTMPYKYYFKMLNTEKLEISNRPKTQFYAATTVKTKRG